MMPLGELSCDVCDSPAVMAVSSRMGDAEESFRMQLRFLCQSHVAEFAVPGTEVKPLNET